MDRYNSVIDIGKRRRLNRIFAKDNKCVLVPLDDSLISGSTGGLSDLKSKVQQIESVSPSALMAFPGTLSLVENVGIPLILNLTASTVVGQHTNKILVSSVERAVRLGADAVAVHINFSSKYESDMLRNCEIVKEKCDKYGMPLMILAYPRCESIVEGKYVDNNYLDLKRTDNEKYTKLVCHCVRSAFELGADIIKAQYTGSSRSFLEVIRSAVHVPVLIAGGEPKEDITDLFSMIQGAMESGASGVSIGRYVFNNDHSDILISVIKQMVYNGLSAKEAYSLFLIDNATQAY